VAARAPRGIPSPLLIEQVENTARWALELESPWRAWLRPEEDRLRVMLAAHFTTVATFVPTDVDSHIRFHVWQELDRAGLERALADVDEAASWDPSPVSARVVDGISGHAGEWLAVRAGALGRALTIGAADLVEKICGDIERELAREAEALSVRGDFVRTLCLSTISAHNCGDLSRVIEAWPKQVPQREEYARRFARLGHEDASRYGGAHHLAGHLNKEVMASENHRFLALRAPRCLRRSRSLLIPIGPFFDRWGRTIARELSIEDRSEVLGALLYGLEKGVDRWGYHRAVAGIHEASPGGVDALRQFVPARLRHMVSQGPVRDAIRTSEDRFLARIEKAYRNALASYRR
jgi:hypothetical protein